jgi:phage terminase small subunit
VHRNATKAAIEAGYSEKTAKAQGSRLLTIVDIQTLVAELLEKAAKNVDVTAERVIREMGALAFSDVRNLVDEEGRLKPIKELDDQTAAAIASIEVQEEYDYGATDEELEGQPHGGALKRNHAKKVATGRTVKIKLWDKNSAAEKLMRHLGMFEKDNGQKTNPVTELLALIHGRSSKLPIKE